MNRAERRQQKRLAKQAAKKKAGMGAQSQALQSEQYQNAVAAYQSGNKKRSEELCRQILRTVPDYAEANHLLGILVFQNGDPGKGRKFIERAIASEPQPSFCNSLGNILKALGNLDKAATSYRQAIHGQPEYAEAHFNLGNCLRLMNRPADAAESYRNAVMHQPGYVAAHTNLGLVLTEMGRFADAVDCCREAVALKPDHANAQINLGNALKELGEFVGAESSYRKAIKLQPELAEAHMALAGMCKAMGRTDDAVASYKDAVSLDPDSAEGLRLWAHTKRHLEHDRELEAMEQAFITSANGSEQRMHLAFGLGKAFEDLGGYDEAFKYLSEGNRIKHGFHPDALEEETEAFFETLKDVFCPELFKQFPDSGCKDKTPIFILGMPRSGTSLIEQVLASHSAVHGGGELPVMPELVRDRFPGNGNIQFVRSIPDVTGDVLQETGAAYVKAVREYVKGTQYVTDKRPLNFIHVGLIKLILPNARIIHCVRTPEDTCFSIYKSYFPTRTFQFADDLEELGAYYNRYRDLMRHWHAVLPGFIHDFCYEDMISDQEGQTRELLNICGLDWEDACLEFYRTKRQVRTASAEQVRQPIYSSSIGLWKRYETHLVPLLESLEKGLP